MKIYLTKDLLIEQTEERELLIMGNDGANVIEVYNVTSDNIVTLSFKRSDGFLIHELPMTYEGDCWFYTITNDSGILAVDGELQISLHIRQGNKLTNTTIVTAKVMPSITICPEDPNWYINLLAEEINNLKTRILVKPNDSPADIKEKSEYITKVIYQGKTTNKVLIPKTKVMTFEVLLVSYGSLVNKENNQKIIQLNKIDNHFYSGQDVYVDFVNNNINGVKLDVIEKEDNMLVFKLTVLNMTTLEDITETNRFMITSIKGERNDN